MITLKQYDGSLVAPADDAALYAHLDSRAGVIAGCEIAHLGANQISIAAGYGLICGRVFEIEAETILAELAASGTQSGRLLVQINLANASAPISFVTQAATSLPELVQEDLNAGGTTYQLVLATYTVTTTAISNLAAVPAIPGAFDATGIIPIINGGTGASTLGELIKTVFTNGSAAVAREYPAMGGYYCTTGTEIFENLSHPHSNYGVLVIFMAFIYQLHIYVDLDQRLFYGWSSNSGGAITEPTVWESVDAIVDEGTSGVWTYRKYRSGLAECWGAQDYAGECSTEWGAMYILACAPPSYPITFIDEPAVISGITLNTGGSCWLSGWSARSATNPGTFALVRPTAGSVNAKVAFRVTGRWK